MMTCGDVMRRDPVYCAPQDPVTTAADLMRTHDVGSLPVVDSADTRRLVGIVTERDLVIKVVAGNQAVARATVRDAMTRNPWTCREDEDLARVATVMAERQLGRMPVVDGQGHLVGVIARADVATLGGSAFLNAMAAPAADHRL